MIVSQSTKAKMALLTSMNIPSIQTFGQFSVEFFFLKIEEWRFIDLALLKQY